MPSSQKNHNLEGALVTALEYEKRVRNLYYEAANESGNERGRKIFRVLADEEQGHVDLLEQQLGDLKRNGAVSPVPVTVSSSSQAEIDASVGDLRDHLSSHKATPGEVEILRQALYAEEETSKFYETMLEKLAEGERQVFFHLLAVEDGHREIVQAEIDALSARGSRFDTPEYDHDVV